MKLTVAELFAGVGGFRVGFNNVETIGENGRALEQGPWDFVWANQFEPSTKEQHAFDCYTTRFGSDHASNEDIHSVDKNTIPTHSLLVGGFPCQDYSVARSLLNEKGIEGKKGVLFWDLKDVISAKKPPFVLLENVDRLLKSPSAMRGRDFAIMLKTFDELGYDVQWRVINAADYGMPQKRRRVFIFAYSRETKYAKSFKRTELSISEDLLLNQVFPIAPVASSHVSIVNLQEFEDTLALTESFKHGKFLDTGYMTAGTVWHSRAESCVEDIYSLGEILEQAKKENGDLAPYVVAPDRLEKWKYLKGAKRIERTSRTGHTYFYSEGGMSFPENLDSPARTMLTSEGTLNRSSHIIYDKNLDAYRTITPVECELIQMFPPNWTATMTMRKRYFMMGNALVTGVIRRLSPHLAEIISKE